MLERTFGHYARVLVDVDLAKKLIFKILVERKGFAFFVDVEYENLPPFCDHYKVIGHNFDNCKRREDSVSIPKKPEISKPLIPVQPKNKVDELVNVEGSSSKQYHELERNEADKLLEEEINKESDEEVLFVDKPALAPTTKAVISPILQVNSSSEEVLIVDKPAPATFIQAENSLDNSQFVSSPHLSIENTQV
ncbi:hypothetical protein P8452_56792 [Trifolium repens]|jgi:hypothetical protein|nr:hypothetical protein P8452_56792 [Trifolium repens]